MVFTSFKVTVHPALLKFKCDSVILCGHLSMLHEKCQYARWGRSDNLLAHVNTACASLCLVCSRYEFSTALDVDSGLHIGKSKLEF